MPFAVAMAVHGTQVKLDLDRMRDSALTGLGTGPAIATLEHLRNRHLRTVPPTRIPTRGLKQPPKNGISD